MDLLEVTPEVLGQCEIILADLTLVRGRHTRLGMGPHVNLYVELPGEHLTAMRTHERTDAAVRLHVDLPILLSCKSLVADWTLVGFFPTVGAHVYGEVPGERKDLVALAASVFLPLVVDTHVTLEVAQTRKVLPALGAVIRLWFLDYFCLRVNTEVMVLHFQDRLEHFRAH